MSQRIQKSIKLAAASTTAVCAAQTPGAAGPLTINGGAASGGVATLDVARRILATTANAGDNGTLLTITGTDRGGNAIQEVLTLNHTTAPYTNQDFLTVTVASISASTAGTVSVGTNGVASTPWIPLSDLTNPFNVGYAANLGGITCNFNVEVTADEVDKSKVDSAPNGCGDSSAAGLPFSTFTPPYAFPALSSQTADVEGQVIIPSRAIRMTVNSGATAGSVRFTVTQAGVFG